MKHAGPAALAGLAGLLTSLRGRSGLREPRPGIFYVKGRAFLHFHEDRAGVFADLREADAWRRLPADDAADCARLLDEVDRALARPPGPKQ
jgi:hypothetical protein